MKLIMMCGLPNSGKTTKVQQLTQQENPTIISLDKYTHLYLDGYKPKDIVGFAIKDIIAALEQGNNVLYDAVNATKFERKQIIDSVDCDVCCVYMKTPVEICEARDEHTWSTLYARIFEEPTEDEGFELIVSYDGVEAEVV